MYEETLNEIEKIEWLLPMLNDEGKEFYTNKLRALKCEIDILT